MQETNLLVLRIAFWLSQGKAAGNPQYCDPGVERFHANKCYSHERISKRFLFYFRLINEKGWLRDCKTDLILGRIRDLQIFAE